MTASAPTRDQILAEFAALLNNDNRPGDEWLTARELQDGMNITRGKVRIFIRRMMATNRIEKRKVDGVYYYRIVKP